MNDSVIFDLDGTLADIEVRRMLSTKANGKLDWDVFFDPANISLDEPNHSVIKMAQVLSESNHTIVILSGRSAVTKEATIEWLKQYDVPYDVLTMRPTEQPWAYMPDDELKKEWLTKLFPDKNNIICVFDDRDKVVDMWRANGLQCFQVAKGDF